MLITIIYTVTIICFILIFCALYMLIRNEVVFRTRMNILNDKTISHEERMRRHAALPSYDEMMWQLWKFRWKVD